MHISSSSSSSFASDWLDSGISGPEVVTSGSEAETRGSEEETCDPLCCPGFARLWDEDVLGGISTCGPEAVACEGMSGIAVCGPLYCPGFARLWDEDILGGILTCGPEAVACEGMSGTALCGPYILILGGILTCGPEAVACEGICGATCGPLCCPGLGILCDEDILGGITACGPYILILGGITACGPESLFFKDIWGGAVVFGILICEGPGN
jgi:hypothetical protein